MSLERKDIRLKVAAELHEMVRILADVADVEIGEYVEAILFKHANIEITKSMLIATRCQRAGLTGKVGE